MAGVFSRPVPMQAAALDADYPSGFGIAGIEWRTIVSSLCVREGVVGADDLKVTQRAAGANNTVDVAPGLVVLRGTAVTGQGKYAARMTGVANLTVPIPGSGTRTHRIVAQLYDKQSDSNARTGGAQYDWEVMLLQDTGSGTPAVPASAFHVALVTSTAGVTSILNAAITNNQSYAASPPSMGAQWEFYGGNGQQVNRRIDVTYAPWGVRNVVDVDVANPLLGSVALRRRGLYVARFSGRLNLGALGERVFSIVRRNAAGVELERTPSQSAGNPSGWTVLNASGPIYCERGDTLTALVWQDADPFTNFNDSWHEIKFQGGLVGAMPPVA